MNLSKISALFRIKPKDFDALNYGQRAEIAEKIDKSDDILKSLMVFGSLPILKKISKMGKMKTITDGNIRVHCPVEHLNCVKHVIFVLKYCMKQMPMQHSRPIVVYLFPTDIKKRFGRGMVTPAMVNSAVAGWDYIIIYREEELLKVLMHEYIHFSRNDNFTGLSALSNRLQKRFPIDNRNSGILYNECWTETMATILYNRFLSDKLNIPFEELIEGEKRHSAQQVNKMLSMQNMTFNDFFNGKKQFKENTSAASYYIFKCWNLHNLDYFMANSRKPKLLGKIYETPLDISDVKWTGLSARMTQKM